MSIRLVGLALAVASLIATNRHGWADEFDLPPTVGEEGQASGTAGNLGLGKESPSDKDVSDSLPPDVPVFTKNPAALNQPNPANSSKDGRPNNDDDTAAAKPIDLQARQTNFDVEIRGLRSESRDGGATHSVRASAHWYGRSAITDDIGAIFNLRARAGFVEDMWFDFDRNVRLDVQELAISGAPTPGLTFLGGRVNIRNGVALGFNPTDWFKANSLIITDSQDPGDRREERLGTVVFDGTTTIRNTLFQFGYRPEIDAEPGSWLTDRDVIGLALDRTNPSDAFYLKATPDLGGNVVTTGNLFVEDGRFGGGVEVSAAVSDSLVLYGETFIQQRRSLASEALSSGFGSEQFRNSIGATGDDHWLGQVAVGGTWSLPEALVGTRDISVSLEYHFNQAGLSDTQNGALAGARGADWAAAGIVRGYAADQQEPLARHQLFARVAWNDFWADADLALIGYYVPADGSGLYQLSASVPLNDNVELNLRGYSTFGSETSIYGSNPNRSGAQIAVKYAF